LLGKVPLLIDAPIAGVLITVRVKNPGAAHELRGAFRFSSLASTRPSRESKISSTAMANSGLHSEISGAERDLCVFDGKTLPRDVTSQGYLASGHE
jgi:hypothetical protein